MSLTKLLVALGLFVGFAIANVVGQTVIGVERSIPLNESDLVIVYSTFSNRLTLVHASRPARRGIRTFISIENATEAERLNELYGGLNGEHKELYLAWPDAASGSSEGSSSGSGVYGKVPPLINHPLHRLGPRWAMAPLLVHEALMAAAAAAVAPPPPSPPSSPSLYGVGLDPPRTKPRAAAVPPPYRWMLVARDDTLWLPLHAVRLLSRLDPAVGIAVSDHFIDFNGRTLLAPSTAAAVCLPCGMDLVALLGRRHPPGVPQPACPVCRPAMGCEFRLDLCDALVGGPQCGSKRFLGSGDRCAHSWVAGGAGLALSATLLGYLNKAEWASCVRGAQPSTGERALSRCLWRSGFAFTHPAAALMAGVREVFSERHMLFGNVVAREELFGSRAEALLDPVYKAQEEAAASKAGAAAAAALAPGQTAAVAAATATAAAVESDEPKAAAAGLLGALALPASTRRRSPEAEPCDSVCRTWVARNVVSVHLDVPYDAGVDVEAAAALLRRAGEQAGEYGEAAWQRQQKAREDAAAAAGVF